MEFGVRYSMKAGMVRAARRYLAAIGFTVGLVGIAQPALAHWQYTRWGMTPAEVIAASNGNARQGDGRRSAQGPATKDVIGTYVAAGRTFEVSFYFVEQRLDEVVLQLRDSQQCQATTRDLLAVYGRPIQISGARMEWNDQAKGNYVKMINVGGYCEIQYEMAAGDAGL
jgi:hypothetical protein